MKNYILYILIFFSLSSCSSIKFLKLRGSENSKMDISNINYQSIQKKDYQEHFKAFEKFYLNSTITKKIDLPKSSQKYIQKISNEIIDNNELFFKEREKVILYVIDDDSPFHFSLPGKKIFLSKGLIKKYIKNEKLLYCLLTYELIRSEKNIYHKIMVIPTGTITTNRLLSIMRLSTVEKVEIHKWAFYILKRVGIDTDIYLSWIQIQNRNSIDFSNQLGDINSISREESLFKAFLIKSTKESANNRKYSGSSKEFYNFIKNIKS